MTAKKRTGGRVTPKGTQPPASKKGQAQESASGPPRAVPGRVDPGHGRPTGGPAGPSPRRPPRRQPLTP